MVMGLVVVLSACSSFRNSGELSIYVQSDSTTPSRVELHGQFDQTWLVPPASSGLVSVTIQDDHPLLLIFDSNCHEIGRLGLGPGLYSVTIPRSGSAGGREVDSIPEAPLLGLAEKCPPPTS